MNDATATAPAIEVVDLVKTFERGLLQAINGASFSVGAGEWVSLCGPSGCGKSTLLHLIAALDRPTSGQIRINGQDLAKIRDIDHYRQFEIGLVFQLHNLLPNLTAVQNIEVALFGSPLSHKAQRERARELLDAVGLGGRPNVKPPALSGGQRQRLAIARALANEPSILLADEPTGSLDTVSSQNVLALFRKIREERQLTILLVTHSQDVAATADRTIWMADGRVVPEPVSALGATHHSG